MDGKLTSTPAAPTGRRERNKAAVRRRLLDAAVIAFTEKGYHAATVDEIAATADVARATAFNHFPRKEEFPLGLVEDRRVALGARLGRHLDRPGADLGEALREAVREMARWYESDARTTKALIRATLQSGILLAPGYYASTDLFATAIAAARERGEVRPDVDPAVAGSALFDVYLGVLYRWAATDPGFSLEEALVNAFDTVVRGLGCGTARCPSALPQQH